MKESQIPFNGQMVRAILAGRKWQTRRIVKLPHQNPLGAWEPTTAGGENGGRTKDGRTIPEQAAIWHTRTGESFMCPHGQPGDQLVVRETCRAEELEGGADGVRFAADGAFVPIADSQDAAERWMTLNAYRGRKGAVVPSIHMPRWAARIVQPIVQVRVERLQDISEGDAVAEGLLRLPATGRYVVEQGEQYFGLADHNPRVVFADLWDRVYAERGTGWEANPWVWVIEFERHRRAST